MSRNPHGGYLLAGPRQEKAAFEHSSSPGTLAHGVATGVSGRFRRRAPVDVEYELDEVRGLVPPPGGSTALRPSRSAGGAEPDWKQSHGSHGFHTHDIHHPLSCLIHVSYSGRCPKEIYGWLGG